MPFMHSWCERLFLISLLVLISIVLADYKFYFLPINGLWLLLYILCVIISTIWVTCVNIQKLLQQNIPFDYNLESFKSYKTLQSFYNFIYNSVFSDVKLQKQAFENRSHTPEISQKDFLDSQVLKSTPSIEPQKDKSIDERIEILVNDIEQKFISKWYNIISTEETFPSESKILLEGIIRRVLQVSVQIDSSKLVCGALVILLKHLKEFRKARKRVHKNGGSIESVYRYSHVGNKSDSALEHFTHRLTANVLREFISWELWNSLPCRLLVSILSKRLTMYLLFYVSQPGWINYKILYQSVSKIDIVSLNLDKYLYISLSDVDLSDKSNEHDKKAVENGNIKEKVIEKSLSSTPQLSPKRDLNLTEITSQDNDSNNDKSESITTKFDVIIKPDSENVIEQALTKMIAHQTAPILQRAEKTETTESPVASPEKTSAKIEATFKPQRSEPVKIHSAKSTSKTWDESELSNVSLGQDLLALDALEGSELQGFSGRRLWGYNADLNEQDERQNPSWESQESWVRDRDKIPDKNKDEEVKEVTEDSLKNKTKRKDVKQSSPPSMTSASAFVTNTIKPIAGNVTATTLHNMRELQQSTVNNVVRPMSNATEKAMHRIGDLQDEAVGVVEGIFDFGMAGIRKGLRLTGLQEVNEIVQKQNKILRESPKNAPKLVKLGHVTSTTEDSNPKLLKTKEDSSESCWMNPIAKEESPNGFENQMLLEKSPNTFDSDIVDPIPEVETNLFLTDSPEYEETADLASTISKLRSLLQQKSSESSLNTPAVSPMPMDDKSCPTPTEPSMVDITKVDGGMQRFARTVTGMFNTFKTALPGNVAEQKKDSEQWIFIENETSETDLPSLLNSLLVERRDYCTVDTAYEAMDSLDLLTESVNSQISKIQWDNQIYEDELDDLDSTIPITKALLDVICECLQDTNCALNQEPVLKALLILVGAKSEKKLSHFSEKILRYVNKLIGPLPKNDSDNVMAMNLEKLVGYIEKSFPCVVKEIFGHDDIKVGLKFLISSLQSSKINQDIMLQIFELICSQLIFASSQMSPTPSA